MRCLSILLLFLFLIPLGVQSQCDPATVAGWQLTSPQVGEIVDQTYEIQIDAPADADTYVLTIFSEYELEWDDVPPVIHLVDEGVLVPGLNTITVTIPTSAIWNLGPMPLWHYFSAELQTTCSGGATSEVQKFYLSSHSLLNDPGFNCEPHFFNLAIPMPDGVDVAYDAFLPVTPQDEQELVESLEVFVDIGHTFAGDFSIVLESPAGTVVTLLDHPSGFGTVSSFSVLFKDDAPLIESFDESINAGPRGIYAPAQPLYLFNGEPVAGPWKITVTDHLGIDDGLLGGVCLSFNGSPCSAFLSGEVFYDLNGTGLPDGQDQPVPFPFIQNTLDDFPVAGSADGSYIDCSMTGPGALSLLNPPNYYTAPDVPFMANQDDWLTNLHFPLVGIPGYYDLTVDVFSPTPDIPGFINTYTVIYSNVGTECIDDAEVEITFPPEMTIEAIYTPGAYTSGNSVIFDVPEICPLESGSFEIDVLLADTTSLGAMLAIDAVIEPLSTDETPHNNTYTFYSEVIGAYDPNDKQVDRTVVGPTFMENDASLKYLVRFQNTGTYYAQNVIIVDTLSPALDLMTFELLDASHEVDIYFQDNVAYFNFYDIMLPDSTTDLAGSIGFVRFSIGPHDDFSPGETIGNEAYIYFDFNPPILTNTATTLYALPVGLAAESAVKAKAWPNPVADRCFLEWPTSVEVEEIRIFDMTGRCIATQQVAQNEQAVLHTSYWSPGIYTLVFEASEPVRPLRIVRQ